MVASSTISPVILWIQANTAYECCSVLIDNLHKDGILYKDTLIYFIENTI